jgi:hypothetical protein
LTIATKKEFSLKLRPQNALKTLKKALKTKLNVLFLGGLQIYIDIFQSNYFKLIELGCVLFYWDCIQKRCYSFSCGCMIKPVQSVTGVAESCSHTGWQCQWAAPPRTHGYFHKK